MWNTSKTSKDIILAVTFQLDSRFLTIVSSTISEKSVSGSNCQAYYFSLLFVNPIPSAKPKTRSPTSTTTRLVEAHLCASVIVRTLHSWVRKIQFSTASSTTGTSHYALNLNISKIALKSQKNREVNQAWGPRACNTNNDG